MMRLEQHTWFRLFWQKIKCAALVVPSFYLQWKSNENNKHHVIQMLLAINWCYSQVGKNSRMRMKVQDHLMQVHHPGKWKTYAELLLLFNPSFKVIFKLIILYLLKKCLSPRDLNLRFFFHAVNLQRIKVFCHENLLNSEGHEIQSVTATKVYFPFTHFKIWETLSLSFILPIFSSDLLIHNFAYINSDITTSDKDCKPFSFFKETKVRMEMNCNQFKAYK